MGRMRPITDAVHAGARETYAESAHFVAYGRTLTTGCDEVGDPVPRRIWRNYRASRELNDEV